MGLEPKHNSRIGSLKTPFGTDELVLVGFDGSEGLGENFEFHIKAYSETENINFDQALGSNCSVTIKGYGGYERNFSGVLVEAQWLGMHDRYFVYQLVLRPWFWLLSRTFDCRIFHEKNVPDIIKEIFGDHGFAKFESKLTESYPKLEYCVQYRESDLNFISRLMEYSGIYYYYKHVGNEHTLVMTDAKSSHKPKEGKSSVVYRTIEKNARRKEEHFVHWQSARSFQSGRVVLNDYDYLKPTASLESDADSSSSYTNSKLEIYDYPGKYVEKGDGNQYAKIRLQSEQAKDGRRHASGDAPSCYPGVLVKVEGHTNAAQNKEYLVIRVSHSFTGDDFVSGGSSAQNEVYVANYELLGSDTPFRSEESAVKPRVFGPQTAKVVGSGEIDVDEHGRILVQFHWDRKKGESRRVRVSQVWSGKKWGGIIIPRVGMEVVVEFIEGDPDRPLVVGSIYNGDNKPPYDLPGEKNIAGWKSDSTEGGGGYNEHVFDDTKGDELIRIHGEKNLNSIVKNDEIYTTGNDESREVGRDRSEEIGRNFTQEIGRVKTVTAGEKIEFIVGQSRIIMEPSKITIKSIAIEIKADATIDVKSPLTTVKGSAILTLQGGLVKIN